MLNTKEKGKIGEDIACRFLENKGFRIIERNYLKRWGEIDIVATKKDRGRDELHFIEVKSVIVRFRQTHFVSHDPEENVHMLKTDRLKRVIGTYLTERGYGLDHGFHFHVVCAYLNEKTRLARIKWSENVIL